MDVLRQAIWCCDPSPGRQTWTWTRVPVLVPALDCQRSTVKAKFHHEFHHRHHPCRIQAPGTMHARVWAPLSGVGSHSRRRRQAACDEIDGVGREEEQSRADARTSRTSQGLGGNWTKSRSRGLRAEEEEEIRRELGPSTAPSRTATRGVLERRLCMAVSIWREA